MTTRMDAESVVEIRAVNVHRSCRQATNDADLWHLAAKRRDTGGIE